MSAITAGVPFAVMATKRTTAKATTSEKEPFHSRLDGELLDRARDFIKQQPVKPTLTAVVETALRYWLDHFHPKKPK